MQVEQTILRRFEELDTLAQKVNGTKSQDADFSASVNNELFQQWATSVQSLIDRACGAASSHAADFKAKREDYNGWWYQFTVCRGVFAAAWDDYKGGHLASMRALIDAEICSDVLEQAEALLSAGYKDAACVIAGCALETALLEMSKANGLPAGKLDAMNSGLAKANKYNVGMQKQVTAWADLRNRAAHGKWDTFGERDVRDLIDGARRFIAERM